MNLKLTAAVLPIIAVVLSCTTAQSYRPMESYEPQPRSEADIVVYLPEQAGLIPPGSRKVGAMDVGDTGFTTECSRDTVIGQLKREAAIRGVDAVQIYDIQPPDFGSTCWRMQSYFLVIPAGTSGGGNAVAAGTATGAAAVPAADPRTEGGLVVRMGSVAMPTLGLFGYISDGGFAVDRTTRGDGSSGDVIPGDTVTNINGIDVQTMMDFYEGMLSCRVGSEVPVTRIRNGQQETVPYLVGSETLTADKAVIISTLVIGDPVNLAIVVSSVESIRKPEDIDYESWKKASATSIHGNMEADFLNTFASYTGFAVVDRSAIDTVMREQEFGLEGRVDDPVQIGALVGANAVLDVSMVRYPDAGSKTGFEDSYTRRLIEVRTGRVLATVKISAY